MANFSMADVYGPNFGYATTRGASIPEQNDQEALQDADIANEDLTTAPTAKRNMMIFVVAALAMIVLFSLA